MKLFYPLFSYSSGTQRDKQSIKVFFNFVYYKTCSESKHKLTLSTRKIKEKWRWQERFCSWFWLKFVLLQDHTLLHTMTWIIMTCRLKNRVIYQRVLKKVQMQHHCSKLPPVTYIFCYGPNYRKGGSTYQRAYTSLDKKFQDILSLFQF